jgi:hypothetical protein
MLFKELAILGEWGSPKAEAQKVHETYREAGGNFIDTSTPAARAKNSWLSSSGAIATVSF